jgi:hypothetical protein
MLAFLFLFLQVAASRPLKEKKAKLLEEEGGD